LAATAAAAAAAAEAAVCVASLRTETLGVMLEIRGNMGQCEPEDQDFEGDYAKEKLKKTWDSVSLRTETLTNRKEDFRRKVLKNREKK
jgi:hypothetical protein